MDLELEETQGMIQKTARDFFTAELSADDLRKLLAEGADLPDDLWRQMAELGWMGINVPEELDGFGGGMLDMAVLLEEMGYFAVPGPYFATVVLGASAIARFGSPEQQREWLPRIAAGELKATLALTEPGSSPWPALISTTAVEDGAGYRISGRKFYVDHAHVADLMIVAADVAGATTLFVVDAGSEGIDITQLKTIDGSKFCEVSLDRVPVPAANVLGAVGGGREQLDLLLRIAALSACARMLGGMRRALEMTVAHVKERKQFGQPVGAFQAVQHHCSNMAMDLEVSRLMTYEALWRMDQALDCERSASMAKAWVGEAYGRVMLGAHQCIGGLAFIEEHDLPLYSKSATGAELLFGDSDFHRELVAREIGL